jgi:hypothetical protein
LYFLPFRFPLLFHISFLLYFLPFVFPSFRMFFLFVDCDRPAEGIFLATPKFLASNHLIRLILSCELVCALFWRAQFNWATYRWHVIYKRVFVSTNIVCLHSSIFNELL